MFPDRQYGPHRDWKEEVQFLDNIFPGGAAYSVGKVNGDHWLLYITNPPAGLRLPSSVETDTIPDYTIEILMSGLGCKARDAFVCPELGPDVTPSSHAQALSSSIGISDIFPREFTTLDAYTFTPCGYSSNALIRWGEDPHLLPSLGLSQDAMATSSSEREGYYTIHVTPEEGWSYASFECNVPLPTTCATGASLGIPDLRTLVRRVVDVFSPGRLSLTLFISSKDNPDGEGPYPVDLAQRAFRLALTSSDGGPIYRRSDKINYEFGDYDLAFASFEQVQ